MTKFKRVLFWIHFVAGVTGGIVIFIMCVTGVLLAFERNFIELADGKVRQISEHSGKYAPPSQIINAAMDFYGTGAKPTGLVAYLEPGLAWQVNFGRKDIVYVNPITATVTGTGNHDIRAAMEFLRELHRYLALSGEARPVGKAITGASNLLFVVLCFTGLIIWTPRIREWRRIRPKLWFRTTHSCQARDFNWHNTIGFWSSLILIVITITATVISYKWAADLLTIVTGGKVRPALSEQNRQQQPSEIEISDESPDRAMEQSIKFVPYAKSISLRLPVSKSAEFTVDEGIYLNRFGRSNLVVSTEDGSVIKWEPYGESEISRQVRSWFRFLHTGEIAGLPGQILGAVASFGGAVLVWTGFGMAYRRLRNMRRSKVR